MSARALIGVYPTLGPRAAARRGGAPAFPFNEPSFTLTHLGRGAVWLAVRGLGLGPGSRVAMPAYHCGSEVEAVRLAGAEVVFYRVDGSLRVDQEDLRRAAASADAAYLISHFGFPMPPPPQGVPVIEDVAHGLFSLGAGGPLGHRADAAVFCPRKSLGVPDGGGLLLPGREVRQPGDGPPARGLARSLASLLAARAALSPRRWVQGLATALIGAASRGDAATRAGTLTETVIGRWDLSVSDMEAAAAPASGLASWLARRVESEEIRRRRRANYAALLEELSTVCPEPYRELPAGMCPLYFPALAPDRTSAMARLLERGVRAIEIWPVPHPLLDRPRFAELEPAWRGLLALPVHQDLEPWHVETVVRAAKEAFARRGV